MLKYTKFIQFQPNEITWDFGKENPYFSIPSQTKDWPSTVRVDPFPCTGIADIEYIKKVAEEVHAKFPIGTLLTYAALPFEFEERTNAWASSDDIWKVDTEEEQALKDKHLKEGRIVFTGRRTIIHPALVRYLVAHEYGHHVDYWITAKMRIENGGESSRGLDYFRNEYREFRGLPKTGKYSGGDAYKASITEVIANDFRIVVCGIDPDIYPHPYDNPYKDPKIKKYWKDIIKKYSFKDE